MGISLRRGDHFVKDGAYEARERTIAIRMAPTICFAVDSPEFAPLKVLVIERFRKLFDIVGSG